MENLIRTILSEYYYGRELEEKIKRHLRTDRYVASIAKWIDKHGFDQAKEKFKEYYEKQKAKLTLPYYIEKHGLELGTELYAEKNSKLSVGENTLRKSGKSEDEIREIKENHSRKSSITLESLQNRYGAKEGKRKWEEIITKKKFGSKRCVEYWIINGYTLIEAQEMVGKEQKRDVHFYLEKGYTEKEILDLRKRQTKGFFSEESIKKRFSKQNSKKQIDFSQLLYDSLCADVRKIFKGQPITTDANLISFGPNEYNRKFFCPDIMIGRELIIEFDGDYYHPEGNERDLQTNELVEKMGYTIHRVKESEFILNEKITIDNTASFIYRYLNENNFSKKE